MVRKKVSICEVVYDSDEFIGALRVLWTYKATPVPFALCGIDTIYSVLIKAAIICKWV